jgi:hypothetical protein
MAGRRLAVEKMTDKQLLARVTAIASDLRFPSPDLAWVTRRRRIPDELDAIALELMMRGRQLSLLGEAELVPGDSDVHRRGR